MITDAAGEHTVDMQCRSFTKNLPAVTCFHRVQISQKFDMPSGLNHTKRDTLGICGTCTVRNSRMLSTDCPQHSQKNQELIYTQSWHQFPREVKHTFCSFKKNL